MLGFRKRKPPKSSPPPRRSYFDLLEEKHGDPRGISRPETLRQETARKAAAPPTPAELETARPAVCPPRARSRGDWLTAALVAAVVATSWLGLALQRPGERATAGDALEPPRNVAAVGFGIDEAREPRPETAAAPAPAPRELAATAPATRLAATPPPRARPEAPTRVAKPAASKPAVSEPAFSKPAAPPETEPAPTALPPPMVADVAPGLQLEAPQPTYPAAARQAGLEGRVRIEARVDGEGRVSEATVLDGAAPALDQAALEAVRRWRFRPAIRDGEPLSYRYQAEFRFAVAAAERPAAIATSDVEPPVRVVSPLPSYPNEAWVEGVEGDVRVRARIDERGEVAGVEVLHGLPHGLTEAALAAVRRWKFRPATRDGRPVAVDHDLSIRFRL